MFRKRKSKTSRQRRTPTGSDNDDDDAKRAEEKKDAEILQQQSTSSSSGKKKKKKSKKRKPAPVLSFDDEEGATNVFKKVKSFFGQRFFLVRSKCFYVVCLRSWRGNFHGEWVFNCLPLKKNFISFFRDSEKFIL